MTGLNKTGLPIRATIISRNCIVCPVMLHCALARAGRHSAENIGLTELERDIIEVWLRSKSRKKKPLHFNALFQLYQNTI